MDYLILKKCRQKLLMIFFLFLVIALLPLIIIVMNSNQRGPLPPQQLFRRLLTSDFRESECIDEASKLRGQRQILLQLVLEYEQEIRKVAMITSQEQQLLAYRQKLMLELEVLRRDRAEIDAEITDQIRTLRLTPVQVRDHNTLVVQLDSVRCRNSKLKIRIRDLMEYISKLQLQNRRLQQERRVLDVNEMQRRQIGEDWRSKISLLQREHFSYEQQIRSKMKGREEDALRSIQAQQLQIKERNRRRMSSFKSSEHSTPYNRLDLQHQSDIKYYRKI